MTTRPPVGSPVMSQRAKRVLIALAGLVVAAILWLAFVGVYVDWLWFGEVGFREVYATRALTRIALFLRWRPGRWWPGLRGPVRRVPVPAGFRAHQ